MPVWWLHYVLKSVLSIFIKSLCCHGMCTFAPAPGARSSVLLLLTVAVMG